MALLLLGLLLAVLGIGEAWFTVISPDPGRIASYHFDSEAMLAHGGWYERSAESY